VGGLCPCTCLDASCHVQCAHPLQTHPDHADYIDTPFPMYELMTELCAPNIATGKHTLSNGASGGRMGSSLHSPAHNNSQDTPSVDRESQVGLDNTQVRSLTYHLMYVSHSYAYF
jgi:hypothetical protein